MNIPRAVVTAGVLMVITLLQPLVTDRSAHAENAPLPSVTKFSYRGKVESINVNDGRLVVNRNSYQLSASTRVYGPTGEPISLDSVRSGIFIAFNTLAHGNSVSDIWIIPVD